MGTAVIYIRKSTESKERQVASLADQLKACQETAQRLGITVVHPEFAESKSAKRPGVRVEFYKMIEYVKAKKADTIICWDASRLSRNAADGGQLIDLVDNYGLTILTPVTKYDSTNDFLLFIEFGMSTDFSKKLSANVKRGLEGRVAKGIYPGPAPLGYKNLRNEQGRSQGIIAHQVKFKLVKKWFEMILSGNHGVISSLRKINALGLTDRLNKPIPITTAHRILRNPFYYGKFVFRGELQQGNHPAMITEDEFDRVQFILDGKRKTRTVTPLPLMGMIKCFDCGSSVTGEKHIKHYKNGTTQTFYYYRSSKKVGHCQQKGYTSEKNLNDQAQEYFKNLELESGYIPWVKSILRRRGNEEFAFDYKTKELQTKRILAIAKEKKDLWNMKEDGLVSFEDYQIQKATLLTEQKDIAKAISPDRLNYWDKVENMAIDYAGIMVQLFNSDDSFVKKMALKILGSNLLLKEEKLVIEPKYAFVMLKDYERSKYAKNLGSNPNKALDTATILQNPVSCEAAGARTQNKQLKRLLLYH